MIATEHLKDDKVCVEWSNSLIFFILLLTSLIILRMENEKLTEGIAFIKRTKNL